VEPATTGGHLADITNAINTNGTATATANNSLLSHAGPEGCPRMASYTLPPPKVLIANRGEIARRVIRTCALHGVDTIAVYTEVDALAPHVREATQAVFLGKNPRDYTNAAKLLKVGVSGVGGCGCGSANDCTRASGQLCTPQLQQVAVMLLVSE
jgi:hypothetical protein